MSDEASSRWADRNGAKAAVEAGPMNDDPDVRAEVAAAFADYERALVSNDVAALDRFFLPSESVIRFGAGENLFGYEAIKAFRAARSPEGLARKLEKTRIVAYGRNCAIAATLFRRDSAPGKIGRQMQTWIRFPDGWRIAAAHISVIDEPAS